MLCCCEGSELQCIHCESMHTQKQGIVSGILIPILHLLINIKWRCTEVQNRRYILSCYPAWHECMFGTNNTPVFHVNHTRYYWTRIHTFGVHCLKASNEKVKQPN